MTGQTVPAYILKPPFTTEQIDYFCSMELDSEGRLPEGAYMVVEEPDGKTWRLKHWLARQVGNPATVEAHEGNHRLATIRDLQRLYDLLDGRATT